LAAFVREATRDNLVLVGKSLVFVLGGVMVVSALVELGVAGWSLRAGAFLAAGLALCGTPLALAFRDAVRAARKGES
jgi:hypothetical protein